MKPYNYCNPYIYRRAHCVCQNTQEMTKNCFKMFINIKKCLLLCISVSWIFFLSLTELSQGKFNLGDIHGHFVIFIYYRLLHKPSGRTYHEEFHPPKVPMRDDVSSFSPNGNDYIIMLCYVEGDRGTPNKKVWWQRSYTAQEAGSVSQTN